MNMFSHTVFLHLCKSGEVGSVRSERAEHSEFSQPRENAVEESGVPRTFASVPLSRQHEGERAVRGVTGVAHDSGGFHLEIENTLRPPMWKDDSPIVINTAAWGFCFLNVNISF